MAKITRKKLARGAKLLLEHIFTPLQSAQSNMTGVGLDEEQLAAPHAPLRVNLSIPHMGAHSCWNINPSNAGHMYAVPFMLPPLQEDLDFTVSTGGNSGDVSSDTPRIVLDEVSVSFDTRAEPSGVLSNWSGVTTGDAADQGKLDYERAGNYALEFAILERNPSWGTLGATDYSPQRVVWTSKITPDPELLSGYLRTGNPFTVTDISQPINPYKCYYFTVTASTLQSVSECELVSLEVSMKFYSPLRARDIGVNIQNIPSRHRGERNLLNTFYTTGAGIYSSTPRPLISTPIPTAGSAIKANAANGVQTTMAVVDEFFRAKLKGGYDMHSEVPVFEEIANSAAYSVIAVPLFNNTRYGGVNLPAVAAPPTDNPYVSGIADALIDRRYIPIVAPMTIHHVLFTYSWISFLVPSGGAVATPIQAMPADGGTAQLQLDMGVAMGTGARADMYGYEQIAKATLTRPPDATWHGGAVDLCALGSPLTMPRMGASINPYNLELHSMNLEGAGQPGLNGMTAQGPPIFVGRSLAGVAASLGVQREDMAHGAIAKTHGAEQWLEVRASISPMNSNWGATWAGDQLILGSGGIWVYIIGKTQLV